jgi:hypothetical protein
MACVEQGTWLALINHRGNEEVIGASIPSRLCSSWALLGWDI